MPSSWFALLRRRRLSLIVMACLLVLLPIGCAKLEQTERELVFRIEPGSPLVQRSARRHRGRATAVTEPDG